MKGNINHRLAATFTQRVGARADAGHVAGVLVLICRDISAALEPILGREGVTALFERSLHRTAEDHAWTAEALQAMKSGTGLEGLEPTFARQDPAHATAGGLAFFDAFYALLSSLVGLSLADQLLQSVGHGNHSGASAKDTFS